MAQISRRQAPANGQVATPAPAPTPTPAPAAGAASQPEGKAFHAPLSMRIYTPNSPNSIGRPDWGLLHIGLTDEHQVNSTKPLVIRTLAALQKVKASLLANQRFPKNKNVRCNGVMYAGGGRQAQNPNCIVGIPVQFQGKTYTLSIQRDALIQLLDEDVVFRPYVQNPQAEQDIASGFGLTADELADAAQGLNQPAPVTVTRRPARRQSARAALAAANGEAPADPPVEELF